MPFVDPNTVSVPATNGLIPAAWGTSVRDGLLYLATGKPRCRVFNNAAISIANNTETLLTFNSERYDVGACHSTSSNTGRLTVPGSEGGLYGIFGHFGFATSPTGVRAIIIRLNGSTHLARQRKTADNLGDEMSIYTEYQLVAGDFLELTAFQTSGGSLNVTAGGNYSPEFGMRWLGTGT